MAPDPTLRAHLDQVEARPLAADARSPHAHAYHGYGEQLARLGALSDQGARVACIGHSVRGVPLFAARVGPDDARAIAVVLAGLHPMEWIGVETALAMLERLALAPPEDRAVLVVPLVNVDGYRVVEADLRAGRRRFRRANADGVDLNRNFPTHFKAKSPRLGRLLAGYNHGGPHPLSAPEVAAVVDTLDAASARARIDRALSLHSTGRMLLTPYGGVWRAPDDAAKLLAAARAIRDQLAEPYGIRQSARWVPGAFAHGMELDHLHARYGATAILLECGMGDIRLGDPSSYIEPFRWFNPRDPARVAGYLAETLTRFVRAEL